MKHSPVCLIRVHGTGETSPVISIEADRFTIGRVGADYLVQDKGVSRIHLTVHIKGNEIWLEDMSSANGTFVGDKKIPAATLMPYKLGTRVRLGLAGDTYSFEVSNKIITQKSAEEAERALEMHPSRALSTPAPTSELAEKADQFLREARQTATGIKEAAIREAEILMNNARKKAGEMISSARAEAVDLIEKARSNASQATLEREGAAETLLTNARREALQIKTAADEDAEKVTKDARAIAVQVKLQAQRDAEQALQSVRSRSEKLKEEAETEAREVLKETREKARLLFEENEKEIETAMQEARKAAAIIRSEADLALEKARAYLSEKGANILSESEANAQRIVARAEQEAEEIRNCAKQDSQRAVESALQNAQDEIEQVKAAAAHEIKKLEEEQTRLQFEVSAVENRKKEVQAEVEKIARDFEAAKALFAETQKLIQESQAEQERARAELSLAQTMRENAEKSAKELREEREKSLMDFENRKKQQDTEISAMKLKWIEEMKALQVEEEARQLAVRQHQVAEMTRHLEMILVPMVQKQLGGTDATAAVEEFKTALGPVVKRVMFEEKSANASEIEQVVSSDPIIEKYKRRQRFRQRAVFALPIALFVLSVIAPQWFEFVRRPLEVISGGKTVADLAAERRLRDIASRPQFDPPQNESIRSAYTDSVIYTRNYVSRKLDAEVQKKWVIELQNYMFRQLELPEQATVDFIAVETRLIKELQIQRNLINPKFIDAGIERMREIERRTIVEMKGKVGGDLAFEKIRAFEKDFFSRLMQP